MDEITTRVRRMYEMFPYPTKNRGRVADINPRLLLSYLNGPLPARPLRFLDAGCGTGLASLGTALTNPQVECTAIDMNRSALAMVRAEAEELKLQNLQLLEVDLMTLEGLPVPDGGFDVILCSGVLHHLADPSTGLARLREVLSPRGVMRVMVYGRNGRHGLYRFVEALNLLYPEREELEPRLALGRRLMKSLAPGGPVTQPPWEGSSEVDDVEFVDRYLNLNDRAYSIPELRDFVGGAGLKLLRWTDERHWSLSSVTSDPDLRADLGHLPREQVWEVVDLLSNRHKLDFILCHQDAEPRRPPVNLARAWVAISPQTTIRVSQRLTGETMMQFDYTVSLRDEGERPLTHTEKLILDQASPGPVSVSQIQQRLGKWIPGDEVLRDVARFLEEELLYRPSS